MSADAAKFNLLGFDVFLLEGGADAAFSVQEWRAPPRAGGIPVHFHDRTEEAFYVVDGEIGLWLEDRSVVRRRGAYVVVPPGCAHTFWNPADQPATYLTVISPRGFERYLAMLHAKVAGAGMPE